MELTIECFNNNLGSIDGAKLMEIYHEDCQANTYEIENRSYHIGLKSLFNCDAEDTKFIDGELITAEGLSARLLMFR